MAEDEILNSPRIKRIKDRIAKSNSERERKSFLASLVKEIVSKLSKITIGKMEDSISVDNFDEVTAALRNELSRANKPLMKLLESMNLTNKEQTHVIEEIEDKSQKEFRSQFQPVLIKRPRDLVEITNLEEIFLPETMSINNLRELKPFFDELAKIIEKTFDIPSPKVTVLPTPVNIPKTEFNVPEVDFTSLIKEINLGLNKLRTNDVKRPLAVRLSDGSHWIKKLVNDIGKMSTTLAGFSDMIRLRGKTGGVINPATDESVSIPNAIASGLKNVTSAGTAVKLVTAVTLCKEVIITGRAGIGGKIYIGGASVSSTSGTFIFSSQTIRIPINDVSKIFIDADTNGEGVQFTYVT